MKTEPENTPPEKLPNVEVSGLFGGSTLEVDKPPLKSKKFVAFLVTMIGFFGLAFAMLYATNIESLGSNLAFMTVIVTAGVLACAYIGGQALVDRYTRVATIMAGKGTDK